MAKKGLIVVGGGVVELVEEVVEARERVSVRAGNIVVKVMDVVISSFC